MYPPLKNLNLIVAHDENRVIGSNGRIPWAQPRDLNHFYNTTIHHTVIMGSKTFQSINNKPLPNRINIVLTRNKKHRNILKDTLFIYQINHILKIIEKRPNKQFFVIGGQQIYEQFLAYVTTLYITKIHATINNGDAFFPEIDDKQWNFVSQSNYESDMKNKYPMSFLKLER